MHCSSCDGDFDPDAFSVDARVPRGRASACKTCRAGKKRVAGVGRGTGDGVGGNARVFVDPPVVRVQVKAPRVDGQAALDAAIAVHRRNEALLEVEEEAALSNMAAYLASRDSVVAAEAARACEDRKVLALQVRRDLVEAQGGVRAAMSRVLQEDVSGTRWCAGCARAFPATSVHFAEHARGPGGLSRTCVACVTVQRECKVDPDLFWQARFQARRDREFEVQRGGVSLASWALSCIVGNEAEEWESAVDVARRQRGNLGREKCAACHTYFPIQGFGPLAGRCPSCAGSQVIQLPAAARIDRHPVASLEIAMPSLNGMDVVDAGDVDADGATDLGPMDASMDWFGDACE